MDVNIFQMAVVQQVRLSAAVQSMFLKAVLQLKQLLKTLVINTFMVLQIVQLLLTVNSTFTVQQIVQL